MTTETTRRPFRTALVTVALVLTTTAGLAAGASADVLTPLEEVGAPGGGGGIGSTAPTQNAQSIQRTESTQTVTGVLAGGESQAPQALGNHVTAY